MQILLIIFVMANKFLNLVPVEVQTRTNDIGLVIMFLAIAYFLVFRRQTIELFSIPLSWLLIAYLFFMLSQSALASIYYGQNIVDGIIAVRHEFYYLSFFLFFFSFSVTSNFYYFCSFSLSVVSICTYAMTEIFSDRLRSSSEARSSISLSCFRSSFSLSVSFSSFAIS